MKINIPDEVLYGGLGFLIYKYKRQVNNFACELLKYYGKKDNKNNDGVIVDIMGDVIT